MFKSKKAFAILAVCAALVIGLPRLLHAAAETEPNDNTTQADQLKPGATYSGQLSSCADVDWFSATTAGPDTIAISTTHPFDIWAGCYGNYLKITVYDGSNNILANVVELSCGRNFEVGVGDAGTYYVEMAPAQDYSDCPAGVTQPYTLTVMWKAIVATTTTIQPTTTTTQPATTTIHPTTTTSMAGTGCTDNDGDDYGINCARGTDCNDNNPLMNPGLYEVCEDGIDNNCNGLTDEQNCVYECPFAHLLGDGSPNLANLRSFRDTTLARNAIGRKVIQIYYGNLGTIGAAFDGSPSLRAVTKKAIEVLVPMMDDKQ